LDHETLSLLKRTGCNYLVYAPESGSPNTLRKIKKKIQLPRITASIREATRQGITVRTNLIIGFPHETRRDVFSDHPLRSDAGRPRRGRVTINIFSPYPGSELYRELTEAGRLQLSDSYILPANLAEQRLHADEPLDLQSRHAGRESSRSTGSAPCWSTT
jgi:radical SAM superfamily enzyme YgiQ (UPF0313 family)